VGNETCRDFVMGAFASVVGVLLFFVDDELRETIMCTLLPSRTAIWSANFAGEASF